MTLLLRTKYNLLLLPAISDIFCGSNIPEFGRTQYFFGAVVLILKQTLCSDGFLSLIYEVTGAVKGPTKLNIK